MDKKVEKTGSAEFDFLKWANYLAFDIIGDLAFGEAFHFIEAGNDHNDGIRVLNERGEWSACVGTMPWIKPFTPYMFWDSFFPQGMKSVKELAVIAVTAVEKRKKMGSNRKDLLHYLINARDPDTDEPISDSELKAEALTQLIAGSDTTSNSLTHILDILCHNPDVYVSQLSVTKARYEELVNELDAKLPSFDSPDEIAKFDQVKDLPYLNAVIWEVLRYRPTSAMGLPRLVPAGGATICGEFFKEGTVLSVPSCMTSCLSVLTTRFHSS
jgi:benzoate 4-monooxygenase